MLVKNTKSMRKSIEYIEALVISDDNKNLLKKIFRSNLKLGLDETSERMRILSIAISYLGLNYLRTEELQPKTIDCSTLTSQSYWEGAMLGIPFTADRQRSAPDAIDIDATSILPADIVVKYPSLQASPDKTYNHVGLFLGRADNVDYVIESNSKEGCVISTLEEFGPNGGFKRYLKNEHICIKEPIYHRLHQIAQKVPKLSRLGARQYYKMVETGRMIHKGIDIYVPEGTVVVAPIDGVLTRNKLVEEETNCVVITNPSNNIICTLGNINTNNNLSNSNVKKGQVIGKIVETNAASQIDYPVFENGLAHLHFQIHGKLNVPFIPNKIQIGHTFYYNGLYLAKFNTINFPL